MRRFAVKKDSGPNKVFRVSIRWGLRPAADITIEPGFGVRPIALHGFLGHAEYSGRFRVAQPGEETQLHHLGLQRIFARTRMRFVK